MTTKEFQERSDLRIFLSYFKPHKKLFVLDMDGTFYLGNQILPGAADFLKAVEKAGKQYLFFTNNSASSPRD